MKHLLLMAIAILTSMVLPVAVQALSPSNHSIRKQSFNSGWTFSQEGVSGTQAVTLPHDAMIGSKRDSSSAGGSAIAFFNIT